LVSGFWHGANWTFIFWGGFHALAFIPVFLMGRNTIYKDSVVGEHTVFPTLTEVGQVVLTFSIVTFSRIFFRSETLTDAFGYINRIFSNFSYEAYQHPMGYRMIDYYLLVILFVIYEYSIRKDERSPFKFRYKAVRFVIYTLIILLMLLFYDSGVDRSFIYFQF
jgi:D-alanyl-lipoteichoic acid acyltransferase DltB (MBOAT superfamily)